MGPTLRLGRIGGVVVDASRAVLVIVSLLMWSLAGYVVPELASGYASGVFWVVGLLTCLALLARAIAGDGCGLVVDDGRLLGIVTPTDVTAAIERFSLTRPRGERALGGVP
jgi:hypothetical protein